jgi:hypothetical protein
MLMPNGIIKLIDFGCATCNFIGIKKIILLNVLQFVLPYENIQKTLLNYK